MRYALLLFLLLLTAPVARAAARTDVNYVVTPVMDANGVNALRVDMRFVGDASGATTIILPTAIAGENDLWRGVRELHADGATIDVGSQPQLRVLHHRPDAAITLTYQVVQSFDGPLAFDKPLLRPIFQPTWFAVQGEGLFARVDGRPAAQTRFRWGTSPAGWQSVSDAEQTPGRRGASFDELCESVLIGARDLRVVEARTAGGRLRVASIGAPGFDLQRFFAAFRPAATSAAHTWRDSGRDYLVAVIPIPAPPDVEGQLGWSRRDGFALYLTPTVDETTLVHVITHEYLHSWFPNAFGTLPVNDSSEAWFDEGFTDYYADRALLGSGVWTLEDFAARNQGVLNEYLASPERNRAGAELGAHFFDGPGAVQRMSYLRGSMIATRWDARIRAATAGRETLHTVLLRAMAMHDGAAPAAHLDAAARQVGVDLSADFAGLASGIDVDLPSDALGSCIAIRSEQAPVYDRGFPPVTPGTPVGEVDPHSQAYAAGLRSGMIMIERQAGQSGDSRVEQVWRVRDGNAERVIRFFPRGQGTVTMHDVVVTPGLSAAQRARCIGEIVDSAHR